MTFRPLYCNLLQSIPLCLINGSRSKPSHLVGLVSSLQLRPFSSVKESRKLPEEVQTYKNTTNVLSPDFTSPKKQAEKREQFNQAVNEFKKREKYSKGHVELIKVALTRMEELELQKDIAVYNKIISIFPKGRFAPRRMLDAIWPRSIPQLELSLEILTKMEENGIRPNQETYDLLNEIFGKMSLPVQKCIRIAHLFDKYEFADPYKFYYGELPSDPVELSRVILHRITAGQGQVTVHKDNMDEVNTYILSACTESQVSLLSSCVEDALLHVEGPYRLWQHRLEQFYYTLRLTGGHFVEASLPEDQIDTIKKEGAVLSVCMCSPGNQEILEEWMELMQREYPNLTEARVVYDIKEIEPDSSVKRLSATKTELIEDI